MNTHIFDGKKFAAERYLFMQKSVGKLRARSVTPKLLSIIVGENPVGLFYANLKKRTAEEIGIEVEIVQVTSGLNPESVKRVIDKYNSDKNVHGIMIQMPLPPEFGTEETGKILDSISPEKDVDGLGKKSKYSMPTVKAVMMILREAVKYTPEMKDMPCVLVVGHTGFEGGGIYKALGEMGYQVEGANSKTQDLAQKVKSADILISATGVHGLIGKDMVKEGAVVIDVGSPKGDVLWNELNEVASFVSPVPGGVGPVTVSCLLENLVDAAEK